MGALSKKRAQKKRALKKRRKDGKIKRALIQQEVTYGRQEKLLAPLRAQFPAVDQLFAEYQKLFREFSVEDFVQSFSREVLQDLHWGDGKKYQKGILSEYYVFLVLKKLQKEKKIKSFFRTKRYGLLDLRSVDFELVLVGKMYFFFPLQVKSSVSYQKKHKKNKKNIASVVATMDLLSLKEKIEKIIEVRKKYGEILHL